MNFLLCGRCFQTPDQCLLTKADIQHRRKQRLGPVTCSRSLSLYRELEGQPTMKVCLAIPNLPPPVQL